MSFGSVSPVQGRSVFALPVFAFAAWATISCGDQGVFPTTVDPGPDFVQEDVVFDDQFYYCRVEKVLFEQSCGSGVSGKDPASGCHFSVTKFRLTDYSPLLAESCTGDVLDDAAMPPIAAQQNYTAAQARMKRDPKLAQLLLRPLGKAVHPRQIFDENSAEAAVIRQWALRSSSR